MFAISFYFEWYVVLMSNVEIIFNQCVGIIKDK